MENKNKPVIIVQSGVIPYCFIDRKPHVYLVTSIKKGRWILPKGLVEDDLSPLESAILEAYEEAGLIGITEKKVFGSYYNLKWGGNTRIDLYPMKVLETAPDWPEKKTRKRILIPLTEKEIKKRVSSEGLKKVLIKFGEIARDGKEKKLILTK